jgi:hypothetical protein
MVALYSHSTRHPGIPVVVQRSPPNHHNPKMEDHNAKLINSGRRRLQHLSGRNDCSATTGSGCSQAGVCRPITGYHFRCGTRKTILSVDPRSFHTSTTLSRCSSSFALIETSCMESRYQDDRTGNIPSAIPCSKACDFRRSGRYGTRFAGYLPGLR